MSLIKQNTICSFVCMRRLLVSFNFLFLIFGLLLATLPVYFTVSKMLKSWPINSGIIGMGTLLVLIAFFGCYGSRKQHQIILFFYMVILALVCLITFAFSLAALSLSNSQQKTVLSHGWNSISNNTRTDIQNIGHCCGFDNSTNSDNPPCNKAICDNPCLGCLTFLESDWFISFRRATGGVALFVSLLMCISVYVTYRFRHFKNPKANPNEYL